MEMETSVRQTPRSRHSWNEKNECKICGCIRIERENPNASWNWWDIANPETGEITRTYQCRTKQLEMII